MNNQAIDFLIFLTVKLLLLLGFIALIKFRIKRTKEKIASLGKLIKMMSPKTAKATLNYLYDPNLFEIKLDSCDIGFLK